jgi:hypothetical protein
LFRIVVGPALYRSAGSNFWHDHFAVHVFWQPSQEVEEEIAQGRVTLQQRRGATSAELKAAAAGLVVTWGG